MVRTLVCRPPSAVLELKVLQTLHLLALQHTELLAPPIIRHLAHPDLADCVHQVLALRDQNIDLPQLRNDLFRLVSLPCHCSPPECQRHTSSRTTSMGVDQFSKAPSYWPRLRAAQRSPPPASIICIDTSSFCLNPQNVEGRKSHERKQHISRGAANFPNVINAAVRSLSS